jgi:hypothetical protein
MKNPIFLMGGLLLGAFHASSHAIPFRLSAKAWTDMGRIMHVTDTLQQNYGGNWQQGMGMQITTIADLGERLEGAIGFGAQQAYHSLGNSEQEKYTLAKFENYISEARLTYSVGEKANPFFSATIGDFAFNYAPEVKNLGQYLFRGPVYPGFLVSSFKDPRIDTARASFLGLHLHNTLGNFRHDLLFSGERDFSPTLDWSLGYVANYRFWDALEIGAGVNFYHLIAENPAVTSPTRANNPKLFRPDSSLIESGVAFHPYQLQYMEVVAPGDTVTYTQQGTKLMGNFSFDVKRMLGLPEAFGEKDLILYGEVGLIGVKNYGTVYAKRSERMPFMVGFNLPVFGLLDFLSLEVEHYPAKYKADYSKLGYTNSLYVKGIFQQSMKTTYAPSAIPISNKDLAGERYTLTEEGDFLETATGDTIRIQGTELDAQNQTADDWKWSVNIEKTVAGHVQFSGQVANDHFVPRPVRIGPINEGGGLTQAFSSLKDWYFMFRVGYFF